MSHGIGLPHHSHGGRSESRDDEDLKRALKVIRDSVEKSVDIVNQESAIIAKAWTDLEERRALLQERVEELGRLKAALETQIEDNKPKGLFGSCSHQGKRHKSSVEIKKALRKAAANAAMSAFEKADVNGDGDLTIDELRAIEGANAERVMAEADKDGNGSLSKAEYRLYKVKCTLQDAKAARSAKRGALRMFDQADIDGDGDLTIEELRRVEGDNAEKVMREADVDNSGGLSREEYRRYKARVALAEQNAARHGQT